MSSNEPTIFGDSLRQAVDGASIVANDRYGACVSAYRAVMLQEKEMSDFSRRAIHLKKPRLNESLSASVKFAYLVE